MRTCPMMPRRSAGNLDAVKTSRRKRHRMEGRRWDVGLMKVLVGRFQRDPGVLTSHQEECMSVSKFLGDLRCSGEGAGFLL